MLAERPRPEDFPEWCQFLQDPRVAATLGGPRPEARLRQDFDVGLAHAGLPHVLFRLTAGEWLRGPVRERVSAVRR